jgi:hypothetical protein
MKPRPGVGPDTTSGVTPASVVAVVAAWPVRPLSTHAWLMVGAIGLALRRSVGGLCDADPVMSRHTTFRFCLDPTVEQCEVLSRHAGASRFAFNQCLGIVKTALADRKTDRGVEMPWTGFDLINAFNAWKKTAAAGRVFTVDAAGAAEVMVTGLSWRAQVCQQVFEEAAVDLGKGLKSWSDSRSGKREGRRVGFPRFKKKAGVAGMLANHRLARAISDAGLVGVRPTARLQAGLARGAAG